MFKFPFRLNKARPKIPKTVCNDLVWSYIIINALLYLVIYRSRYHDLQPVSRVPTEDGSSCTSVVHANSLNGSKTQTIAYGPATACRTKDKVGSGLEHMRERGEHEISTNSRADDIRGVSFSIRPLVRTAVIVMTQFCLETCFKHKHTHNLMFFYSWKSVYLLLCSRE